MLMKQGRCFYISDSHYHWIKKWAEQADLPMSAIVELLIEKACPAEMCRDGWGWTFRQLPSTFDLEPDSEKCNCQKQGAR